MRVFTVGKIAFVLLIVAATAIASQPRLRLERIDAKSLAEGQLTVFASVVELEGDVDASRSAQDFELFAGDRALGRAERVSPFEATQQPIELVLVVETSALYGPAAPTPTPIAPTPTPRGKTQKDKRRRHPRRAPKKSTAKSPTPASPPSKEEPLSAVKSALSDLLESLAPRYRVLIVEYGGDVTPHAPFRPAPAAAQAVSELSADDESGDLRLADAVRAALTELSRARAAREESVRRLVVVISDGLNSQMDRRTFRTLGDAAGAVHVPIHSIAYSPSDERGPLLNLGEISKRSQGTFRWARTSADLKAQVDALATELNQQYALTFRVSRRDIAGQTLTLRSADLSSNALVIDDAMLAGVPSLSWAKWLRWLGYLAVGFFAFVLFGAYLVRRQNRTHAVLVFSGGRRDGETIALSNRALVIGSQVGTLLITDDPSVSARHAQLNLSDAGATVIDLGSTNGTFVNERRVAQPTAVADGDTLRIGNTRFIFRRSAR